VPPCILGLVDGDREDHLTLANRHFQQTLDVHARVGEFPPELRRFTRSSNTSESTPIASAREARAAGGNVHAPD
jgi:hypothetical protein